MRSTCAPSRCLEFLPKAEYKARQCTRAAGTQVDLLLLLMVYGNIRAPYFRFAR